MLILNSPQNLVVLGINNEAANPEFVDKVRSFCKNDETNFELVHALDEKSVLPTLYADILGSFDITELGQEYREKDEQKSFQALQKLQSKLSYKNPIRSKVIRADSPAHALIEEATKLQASMIAIEVGPHLYEVIPRGLSVALSLMQDSPVPVLLLRRDSPNPFEHKEHRIVITDDLSPASIRALRKGMELAAHWGSTRVIHMHVIEDNLFTTLRELGKMSRKAQYQSLDLPELVEMLELKVGNALQNRAQGFQEIMHSSECTYETAVQIGNVSHTVHDLLKEYNPDLVLFGRQQRAPSKPFGIGRFPFATMLAKNNAVMIVP